MKYSSLLVLFVILTFCSCKKPASTPVLIGKWQSYERFNGYSNGGNFQWNTIPNEYRSVIEFFEDGHYVETPGSGSVPSICKGTYQVSSNTVKLSSDCYQDPYQVSIASLTDTNLELSYSVREGEVKDKFTRLP